MLQDELLTGGVRRGLPSGCYNAEWALLTQLEQVARQFDEMEDDYLRERKADLEQVVDRACCVICMARAVAAAQGASFPLQASLADGADAPPLILVAKDLSPADVLQFKRSVFAGCHLGRGKTSHTAIVARSMDIPAVVGARAAHQLIRQDDWLIVDGDAGVVLVDPLPAMIEYRFRQRQWRSAAVWPACATRRPLPAMVW